LIKRRWVRKSMEVNPTGELVPVASQPSILGSPLRCLNDIVSHRFLVFALVQRTLRSRYRLAGLGYLWLVLEPLLLAATYWFLFVMLAGNPDEMYPVWVLVGVIVWSTFGKSLSGAVSSLTSNTQMIHMAYFPRSIFPVSITTGNIITSLVSSLVLVPIVFVFDTPVTVHLLWVPVGIVLAGVMGGLFGMIFAPLNCGQRDVEHLFRFIVRAGFFFSPVMWTAEMALQRGTWGEYALLNPIVMPITMVRHAIAGESVDLPLLSITSSLLFLSLCALLGSIVFMKSEREAVKFL